MNPERNGAPPRSGEAQEHDMDGSAFPMGLGGPMAPGDDAWIDRLLRDDAAAQPHIADDGFVVRVLMAMPPPRKAAPRWIVPVATVAGCAAAVGLTPAGAWFGAALLQLLDIRHLSVAHLSVLVPVAVFYGLSFSALRER